MSRDLDGVGITAAAAGAMLAYAGAKGYSLPHELRSFITGQAPSGAPDQPVTTPASPAPVPGAGAAGGTAADFLTYVGKVPYVWGGANPSGWDCSGSCNYVICRDAGLAIPGYAPGAFTGASHGPTTLTWLAWAAGNMTHLAEAGVLAGDLIIWQTHMGVCLGGGSYISAYDTQAGTAVEPIHGGGPIGEVATFWRFNIPGGAAAGPFPRSPIPGVTH